MDHNNIFHSKFSGDSSSSSSFDPMFSGVSLQTLLTFNPSLFNDGFHSLTDDPPLPELPESITLENSPKLLIPKTEQHYHSINFLPSIDEPEELLHLPQQPFNFFPTYNHQSFDNFPRLPQLRSPELSFSNRKRLHHHLTTETAPPQPPQLRSPELSFSNQKLAINITSLQRLSLCEIITANHQSSQNEQPP